MTQDELDRIVTCLPSARTLFYYFKDRYALMLLEEVVGQFIFGKGAEGIE